MSSASSKRTRNDIDFAIAEVFSVLEVTFADAHEDFELPTTSEVEDVLRLLEYNVENTVVHFTDVRQAEEGLLMDFDPVVEMQGATNAGNTCYIDTLLFAMFARQRAFDGLLLRPVQNTRYRNLQAACRLFVNQMRRGSLVHIATVMHLQRCLRASGWGNPAENYPQEDVTELFLFLASAFEMPFLPMHNSLLHGGLKDENDEKVVTERALQLSLPDDQSDVLKGPILLEDLLTEHFHGTIVEGIVRSVATDILAEEGLNRLRLDCKYPTQNGKQKENSTLSNDIYLRDAFSTNQHSMRKQGDHLEKGKLITSRPVNAWSVLDLLPFYSSANEQGEIIRDASTSQFDDRGIILPMVLKRYKVDPKTGTTTRNNRSVIIPVEICFNQFVTSATSSASPSASVSDERSNYMHQNTRLGAYNAVHGDPYQLRLRSAICHLGGSSPSSGHYIAYAADLPDRTHAKAELSGANGSWHRLDDLAVFPSHRVVRVEDLRNTTLPFKEMSENAYLLMYELVKGRIEPQAGDEGIHQQRLKQDKQFAVDATSVSVTNVPHSLGLRRTAASSVTSKPAQFRPRNELKSDLSYQSKRENENSLERSSPKNSNDDFVAAGDGCIIVPSGIGLQISGNTNESPSTTPSYSDCDGEIARQLQADEFDFKPHENEGSNQCQLM